ncbi:PSD1 and planctomycete cytochrome C domain-containing protein [Rhodopirellula sp. JC740]|uniref:PSD1 and planctomycete cytochrome C domain-containing protein n=1 Tax=Rhodopirellula halodulae TaxID=2894198 RepID=A0ABS8NMA2_9BACT|nr:PSD1 and planctomycete cytochrome C domain-containing protein [Rhodopirellula sp. JC740]MCC9644675.1 PSD1 and planctomycete cytochrome C domain-containing protein [Rhodopirellula sp. JC740]
MENRDSLHRRFTQRLAEAALLGGALLGLNGNTLLFANDAADAETQAQAWTDDAGHSADDMDRLFTLKVMPLLKEKCLGCHGNDADDMKGDYDVRTRDALLRGGESEEAAIIPGNAEDSPFYWAVTWDGLEMPPKENDRLTEAQTEIVRMWINAGAPWPSDERQKEIRDEESLVAENEDGVLVATSGGQADEWTYRRYQREEVWAFLPRQTEFEHDSIDEFINAKLDEKGIEPGPIASPETLVRRVYFDLIGLPPTPTQTREFLTAFEKDADAAWDALIEELLASPHYGERWGQHWLDVVRYADTGGFSNDYERSNAWRYRDYVIRSLNEDKPYDQFVMEQIAGDELHADKPANDPARVEAMIATGFLRMGPWDTAMVPQEEARQILRDDMVHSIGQSFLSMPMRCCKCHDHKFDPVPTRDYYRMYSAVSTAQPVEMEVPFIEDENTDGFQEGKQQTQALYDYAKTRVDRLVRKREAAAKAWYEEHDKPYKDLNARKGDPDDEKPPRAVGLSETEQGRLKVREQDVWIWNRRLERYEPMAQTVINAQDSWMNARKLRAPKTIKEDWIPENYIFNGGSLAAKGEAVTPGVLSGCGLPVEGAPEEDPFALPNTLTGRRLELAKWIANPENPMSTRSIVNRIWQHHFNQGIVATPNNFGVKGAAPTHPELLDWLTGEFLANDWSIKSIHRMILHSDAYRRSIEHPNSEADPDNTWLARFSPRRLTAEEIRDSLLAVTGELNPTVGGLPARPEINMEVALEPRMIQFSIAPAYQPSRTPEQRNRRSIYAYRVRGQADPFLEVLNKPNPNDSADVRDAASVSPQAFTLLNSDLMTDRAIAMSVRLQREADQLADQIQRAFELSIGRIPTESQLRRMKQYVKDMTAYHNQLTPKPKTYPKEITRSLVEEFSGRPFEYTEWLPTFEDYQSDLKPWEVDGKTRALADMCLVLFNTNEFVFVD